MLGSTVADLRAALGERLPALAPLLSTAMIAVDEEYAGDDVPDLARLAAGRDPSGQRRGRGRCIDEPSHRGRRVFHR